MVKRHDFKTCSQSSFCNRQKAYADLVDLQATQNATYSLVPSSLQFDANEGKIIAKLMGIDPTDVYLAEFHFLEQNTVRFKLTERDPTYPRYDSIQDFSIASDLVHVPFVVKKDSKTEVHVQFGSNEQNSLIMYANPFKFELAVDGVPAISWNERGYFYHEDYRKKEEAGKEPVFSIKKTFPEGEDVSPELQKIEDLKAKVVANYWEESFGGHQDNKPKGNLHLTTGPSSIGLDLSFPGSENVYGLPEHATSFSLKSTR
jgi:mannosyl-oligosaccharide alpha-1,3-glucosidase